MDEITVKNDLGHVVIRLHGSYPGRDGIYPAFSVYCQSFEGGHHLQGYLAGNTLELLWKALGLLLGKTQLPAPTQKVVVEVVQKAGWAIPTLPPDAIVKPAVQDDPDRQQIEAIKRGLTGVMP